MTFVGEITPKYFDENLRIMLDYYYAEIADDDTLEGVIEVSLFSETSSLGHKTIKLESLGQIGEDLKMAIRNYVTTNTTDAGLLPLRDKLIE